MMLLLALLLQSAHPEEEFYPMKRIALPAGEMLEGGGLEWMPDGRLALSTRRGEIWMVADPLGDAPSFSRWAHGLHEVLGIAQRGGWLYAVQRGEVTRIKDSNGDGKADVFETVSDGWEISGDYHEYAFGTKFDRNGDLWIVLCLTGSFTSNVPFRGWCVRVSADGKFTPTCSGIRSPGGMGMDADGNVFYCDNQGPWNGTSSFKHLVPGSFQGHPDGNKWYSIAPTMGPKPIEPKSGSRFHVEAARIPEYVPPPVLLPHGKLGNSASGIECDTTDGKFGPFKKQMFVSDQSFSVVNRLFLEKVNGRLQGAAFPFRQGFGSGNVPMLMTASGALFVAGTNRGWGSRGTAPHALDRVTWSGKVPFEIHEMRIKPDGFELTFTKAADRSTLENPASYRLSTYTYIFQSAYGSPEVDHTTPKIASLVAAADGLSVRMKVDGLQIGHIHDLQLPGVKSAETGKGLLHPAAYYTLWNLPRE